MHSTRAATSAPTFRTRTTRPRRRARHLVAAGLAALFLPSVASAAPGDFDTSFGGTGIVTAALTAGFDTAWGVTLLDDGSIVVVGQTANATTDWAIVRYDNSGNPDVGFGTAGLVTTHFGVGNDIARAVGLQSGNRLVVGGSARATNNDFALARYTASGALDATFGTAGTVISPIGSGNDTLNSLAVQSDDKIVVGGNATIAGSLDMVVARYTADGALDTTFGGGDGIFTTPIGTNIDSVNAVAVQADGKILAVGYGNSASVYDLAVIRLEADGDLDPTFGGGDGIVTTPLGASYGIAYDVVVQPDGAIVVAGITSNGSNTDVAVVRYESDGDLDPTFGTGGIVLGPVGSGDDALRSVALDASGAILVGGFVNNGVDADLLVARFEADGDLDTTFGTSGGVVTPVSGSDGFTAVAIQPDGKLVAAGFTGPTSTPNFIVARYLSADCGNEIVETGEDCDDGSANATLASCCSATCDFQPDGTSCTDEDACTGLDQCDAGSCGGTTIPGCGDHYVTYKIKAPKKDALGAPIANNALPSNFVLTLDDLILDDADADDPENFVAKKEKGLLNPSIKNDEDAPTSPDLRYVRYQIASGKEGVGPADGSGKYPKPAKHIARVFDLDNQFGTIQVASKKASAVLVPAATSLASTPAAPTDATHYTCYAVKATEDVTEQTPDAGDGSGKFRADLQAYFDDSLFGDCTLLSDGATPSFDGTAVEGTCLFDLLKPAELCNPTDTDNVEPNRSTAANITPSEATSDQSLLCYKVKRAKKFKNAASAALGNGSVGASITPKQGKHAKRTVKAGNPVYVTVGNQFPAPVRLDTKGEDMACVPTTVVGVTPLP